ncbi:hypothetical protein WJX72_008974 [[Myrmecia] bisecta]|uniref:Uncharacterized protein n=1 Tax=[Myrmecia] bisecta TaxID=41462 RepID=A0AAW1QS68_9CHLO
MYNVSGDFSTEHDLYQALKEAAAEGQVQAVAALLKLGASVWNGNYEEVTPLTQAVAAGHVPVVELLLREGAVLLARQASRDGHHHVNFAAFINHETEDGESAMDGSPIVEAASKGHGEVVELLQKAAADIDEEWKGCTPLSEAAAGGHEDMVEELLQAGAQINYACEDGNTALMEAASEGHAALVEKMLQAGADARMADADGCTALLEAAQNGHADVVELLLGAGQEVLAEKAGNEALLLASCGGHADVVEVLLQGLQQLPDGVDWMDTDEEGRNALLEAAAQGHAAIVIMLLRSDSKSVNCADEDGRTALLEAAEAGHMDVALLLLGAGAFVNHATEDGSTALMEAADASEVDMVELLLQAGADVNHANEDGLTALMVAVGGHVSLMKQQAGTINLHLLAERDDDPAQSGYWMQHWVHEQHTSKHLHVVELLLAAGADINQADQRGATALIQAVDGPDGAHKVDEMLIKHSLKSLYRRPFDECEQMVRLLLRHGANTQAQSEEGTALDVAHPLERARRAEGFKIAMAKGLGLT